MLVGVGTVDGRDGSTFDTPGLAARAIEAALADSGAPDPARLAGQVGVVFCLQGSWKGDDLGWLAATSAGVPARVRSVKVELGITQTSVIDRAAQAVLTGEVDAAIVVGVETRARAQAAARAGIEVTDRIADREPDEMWRPHDVPISRAEIEAGWVEAVQHYALIENAVRHHDGQSVADHAETVGELWARFDAIAAGNPDAWFAGSRTAADLSTSTAANRPLASPYNKWHSTQWTLDQSTALVITAAEVAEQLGIPADRHVYLRAGADHDCVVPVTERAEIHRSPGAGIVARAALGMADLDLDDVDLVDLYSCFPIAVRIQAREIGLDLERPLTVTGGMPFAGGPFNHYVVWSVATMARALRARPGTVGLTTAVSGMLTKHGSMVWSTEPGDGYWHADLTGAVEAASGRVECCAGVDGRGRLATYTALFDGLEPVGGLAVVDLDGGGRTIGRLDVELARRGAVDDVCQVTVVAEGGTVRAG